MARRPAAHPDRDRVRDPRCGHEPSDALVSELQEHTRTLTAPYKYPREIRFVSELPKTVSGKIRRSELRERLRHEAEALIPVLVPWSAPARPYRVGSQASSPPIPGTQTETMW